MQSGARTWWWVRRGALAVVLAGTVLFPGHPPAAAPRACQVSGCLAHSAVLWTRLLPGAWLIGGQAAGTVPAQGQGYVAAGPQVAVLGIGLTVSAYAAATGSQLWTVSLTGVPAGSAIVAVRAWPGVVTVGVALPPGSVAGPGGSGQAGLARTEVVLNAATGAQLRDYPAASYGGAVRAGRFRAVIVGPDAVTCYLNGSGKVEWRVPTGSAAQDWSVDGGSLYVTHAAQGVLGTGPVIFVRQIYLRTGNEQIRRPLPVGTQFPGTLAGAADGVLLFAGPAALSGYSELTGQRLWRKAAAVPVMTDLVRQVLYLQRDGRMSGIDLLTGATVRGSVIPGPPGFLAVRDGIALGLDPGASGSAWGYNITARKIVWTTRQLPWPHFFADLSGIGGSADPTSPLVLLAACRQARPAGAGAGQRCVRPELVAIRR